MPHHMASILCLATVEDFDSADCGGGSGGDGGDDDDDEDDNNNDDDDVDDNIS